MNILFVPRWLKHSALMFSLVLIALSLVACGGSKNNSSSSSSSSSSSVIASSSSSSSSSAGNAEWPDVNIRGGQPQEFVFSWSPVAGATHYKLFKNADGHSGYQQVGSDLSGTQASDRVSLHLHNWINASYLVEACNAEGCQPSNPVYTSGAMLDAIGFVKASNTRADTWFGWSLALSADGSTLAVGAPVESSKAQGINGDQTNTSTSGAGAVYVFTRVGDLWQQQAYLKASNTEQPSEPDKDGKVSVITNDRFGYRVVLSADGNRLAVSALYEDSGARGINCDQGNSFYLSGTRIMGIDNGAVYVFAREADTWTQEAYIKSQRVWALEGFGYNLDISGDGNTLAVSVVGDVLVSSSISSLSAASECAPANVQSSSVSSSSSSSSSSSTSSSSSNSSSSTGISLAGAVGAVYVYVRTDNGWQPQTYIKASNAGGSDSFGEGIALSHDGSTLAVGAPGENSRLANDATNNDYPAAGAVYVYRRTESSWQQQTYLKPAHISPYQQFGVSLDIAADGNRLAVGAPGDVSRGKGIAADPTDYELSNSMPMAFGAAFVFSHNGTAWVQDVFVKAPNSQSQYEFGYKVALSGEGNVLVVSSRSEASGASGINGNKEDTSKPATGAVYVYRLAESGWTEHSYLKPANTRGGERFGASLGLTSDASLLAVGAYREASQATGVNGDREDDSAPSAGAVYLY